MSDYIKREDAIMAVYSDVTKGTYGEFVDGSEFSMTSREIEAVLKGVPSADVVEVVRCKDCKFFEHTKYGDWWCNNPDGGMGYGNPDDYCSYGERKEQEHE